MIRADSAPSPFSVASDGVRVRLRVHPRARRTAVDGLGAEADGAMAIKVAVTAAPEDGKANTATVSHGPWAAKPPKIVLISLDGAKPDFIQDYLTSTKLFETGGMGGPERPLIREMATEALREFECQTKKGRSSR